MLDKSVSLKILRDQTSNGSNRTKTPLEACAQHVWLSLEIAVSILGLLGQKPAAEQQHPRQFVYICSKKLYREPIFGQLLLARLLRSRFGLASMTPHPLPGVTSV